MKVFVYTSNSCNSFNCTKLLKLSDHDIKIYSNYNYIENYKVYDIDEDFYYDILLYLNGNIEYNWTNLSFLYVTSYISWTLRFRKINKILKKKY